MDGHIDDYALPLYEMKMGKNTLEIDISFRIV